MMEIILIFLQILFIGFLTFYSIPDSIFGLKNSKNLLNTLTMKSIIMMNIFLLFSFLSVEKNYLLFILVFLCLFFICFRKNPSARFFLVRFLFHIWSLPHIKTEASFILSKDFDVKNEALVIFRCSLQNCEK